MVAIVEENSAATKGHLDRKAAAFLFLCCSGQVMIHNESDNSCQHAISIDGKIKGVLTGHCCGNPIYLENTIIC